MSNGRERRGRKKTTGQRECEEVSWERGVVELTRRRGLPIPHDCAFDHARFRSPQRPLHAMLVAYLAPRDLREKGRVDGRWTWVTDVRIVRAFSSRLVDQ